MKKDKGRCSLKNGITFHLFASHTPCKSFECLSVIHVQVMLPNVLSGTRDKGAVKH